MLRGAPEGCVSGRRVESAHELLRAWPERTGLPSAVVERMPAAVALFALDGHPAFGTAVLASLGGGGRAVLRMRAFEGAVEEGLRELGFRLDVGGANGNALQLLAARVELLRDSLSAGQVDQLGALFEDFARTSEPEWQELLLRAVRVVVKDTVDEGTRRAVIVRLPSLGMPHLRELARLRERPERARGRILARPRELTALQSALQHVGFVREAPVADEAGRVGEARGETELRPTTLGLAALRVLGPIEVGEGR